MCAACAGLLAVKAWCGLAGLRLVVRIWWEVVGLLVVDFGGCVVGL